MALDDGKLFEAPPNPRTVREVIAWWEHRRIAFNTIIGVYGVACFMIFLVSIETSGALEPGEDAVEPLALIMTPIGLNVLYTLGWLVEALIRLTDPQLSPRFGPALLKVGIGLSVFAVSVPAVVWGGYRLLQLTGLAS
jgi:hypothetical protein